MEQQTREQAEATGHLHAGVNMDAMEVLQVKRNKTIQRAQKKSTSATTASFKSMETKSSSSSSFALQSNVSRSASTKPAAVEDE